MRIREADAALAEKKRIRQQAVLAFTKCEEGRLTIEFRETFIIRPFKFTKPRKSPPLTPQRIPPPGTSNITLLHIPSSRPDFAVPRITLPAHENPPVLRGGCVCTVFGTTRGESQSGPGEGYPGCDEGETKEWGFGGGILFAWVIKGNGFTDYNDCIVLTYLFTYIHDMRYST